MEVVSVEGGGGGLNLEVETKNIKVQHFGAEILKCIIYVFQDKH